MLSVGAGSVAGSDPFVMEAADRKKFHEESEWRFTMSWVSLVGRFLKVVARRLGKQLLKNLLT